MTAEPTAGVHPSATVHSSCVVEGAVAIGAGTVVGPFCHLIGPLVIGADTRIAAHCVLGSEPEHRRLGGAGTVRIGSGCVLHPLCVVTRGTGARDTRIGDDVYLMDHVHVSHDAVIGDHATVSHNAVFAGHTRVHEGATIGMAAITHQHSTVGAYAMLGMGAVVTRDVPPFVLVTGNPARFRRFNTHALERLELDAAALRVEGGELRSEDERVAAHLAAFAADRREGRQVVALG